MHKNQQYFLNMLWTFVLRRRGNAMWKWEDFYIQQFTHCASINMVIGSAKVIKLQFIAFHTPLAAGKHPEHMHDKDTLPFQCFQSMLNIFQMKMKKFSNEDEKSNSPRQIGRNYLSTCPEIFCTLMARQPYVSHLEFCPCPETFCNFLALSAVLNSKHTSLRKIVPHLLGNSKNDENTHSGSTGNVN